MKKIILAALAIAALASCNKTEVVGVTESNAIAFDNAFVDNATKSVNDPSFTNTNLFSDFAVYGFVEDAVLFNGTKVTGTGVGDDASWTYEGTQYWIAGAQYNFHAVAPVTDGGWTKTAATSASTTLSFTNNGTTDLLYAYAAQQGQLEDNPEVEFSFRHVLSKVKFSFENAYNATNSTIQVREITITNAHKAGNVVLESNETTWSDQDGSLKLEFGNAALASATAEEAFVFGNTVESYNELLLIPGAVTDGYNVTFIVDLLVNGTIVKSYEHTTTVKFTPLAGTCYDINAEINAANIDPDHAQEAIVFTVKSLAGWGEPENADVESPFTPNN